MCHVLHYSCNVDAAAASSLRCRMICGIAFDREELLILLLMFDVTASQ